MRDPVCGMEVEPKESLTLLREGRAVAFCSKLCLQKFLFQPERYGALTRDEGARIDPARRRIAYFTMEAAVHPRMPTYSGGLGVLAADALRSCADLRIPVVGVSLVHRKGYFEQRLDADGNQSEHEVAWDPAQFARCAEARVEVRIASRAVEVRAWQYEIRGATGYVVPLLLLDTDCPSNTPEDRSLTAHLYGGDERYRLAQEIVLGIGGLRMLRELGYAHVERFHMNEGHAALLTLELLRGEKKVSGDDEAYASVRSQCVFTTHTPVPAGHDQFAYELLAELLETPLPRDQLEMFGGAGRFNLTLLAMNLSQYTNGVAKKHGEVSRSLFPGHTFDAVTNGVHSVTWTAESFARVYDRHLPGWMSDSYLLRNALRIPRLEIWSAHLEAKAALIDRVRSRTGVDLAGDSLTIGFARRATEYKRMQLLFRDVDRLRSIARLAGPIQLVLAGKAHPRDATGKDLIRGVFRVARELAGSVRVVYLENYDVELARCLTAGVDLWLNTPARPLEASGTSGMKAAHNGVPSLSVLDGWWIEGHIEGVTGWSIGTDDAASAAGAEIDARDASDLYAKLEQVIVPLYYGNRSGWIDVMRQAIALNASFFNTHRMVQQYAASAYL